MARDSSPFDFQPTAVVPGTPSLGRECKMLQDPDELAPDTVPCSPGAALHFQATNRSTQPTQVMSKPTLFQPSSPSSDVEVPASSPFQQQPTRPKFASRLAPTGTIFRPPPKQQQPQQMQPATKKRPSPGPIYISSDEDELTPPRGDIRPTAFKAQIAQFSYDPEADKRRQRKEKLRQVWDVFGDRFEPVYVMDQLERFDEDIERTIDWLQRNGPKRSKPAGRRLVTKGSLQSQQKLQFKAPPLSSSPAPSPSPSPQKPKPQRRRLMQGLKRQPSPEPEDEPEDLGPGEPSSDDPIIVDLVDNDKEDAYKAERSPSPVDEGDTRVLNSINSSTVEELAAMTGMKEELLQPLIDKRPFDDLAQAQKVCINKKPGARKSARISIGETAVDAITVFLDAVEAIDHVVAQCEGKATAIKEVMDLWNMDAFGHARGSRTNSPDLPPTPTSVTPSRYKPPLIPVQPELMNGHCKMKPFQLFGLNWMTVLYNYGIGCILADEMGLGKTCQVISFFASLAQDYQDRGTGSPPWPNLVVVPPSTYSNWLGEFDKFAPELNVIGYRGSQAERAEVAYEVRHNPNDYHVVLATYSQINSDADVEALDSLDLTAAVFDEGHKMKNPQAKIYKDLRKISASWKMLLTGTPVQNNLLEMISLLNFINPNLFNGYMDQIQYIFSQKVSFRNVGHGAFLYTERVKRARTILEPFILQRRKDQVLDDMPAKKYDVALCEMTALQKSVYDKYEETFKMPAAQRAKAAGRKNDQNNIWMQLRKASIHPLMFRRHFNDKKVEEMAKILMDRVSQDELRQPRLDHLIGELQGSSDFELHLWCRDYHRLLKDFDLSPSALLDSGKVKKLLELIRQYKENGDRVLVFTKFARLLELLREVLAHEEIEHCVLSGETSVGERQDLIDEFNENTEIPVFLLTTGAGGTGINLTSANKVIIFDQSDNPQDDIQAENRAHRLGQRREVEIIRLLSAGTIEELINKACQKKIELANKVTGADEESSCTPKQAEQNMEKEVRKMMEQQQEMTPP